MANLTDEDRSAFVEVLPLAESVAENPFPCVFVDVIV